MLYLIIYQLAHTDTLNNLWQCFETEFAPEGSTWSVRDGGRTKQGISILWFKEAFLPRTGPDRPQLLILDGHDQLIQQWRIKYTFWSYQPRLPIGYSHVTIQCLVL